jgi:hypothetical protein
MIEPHFVQFHDGAGNSYPFLVTQHGADEHMGGFVLVVDEIDGDNPAGLAPGLNARTYIGRGDATKGASWSPIEDAPVS